MNGALSDMPYGALMDAGYAKRSPLDDPMTMGLLQAGLGMLQAGGPSPFPVSLGQAFAQGGLRGLGAYNQTKENDVKSQFMQAQTRKMLQPEAPQSPFGKIDPKDYTPDSVAMFMRSQNFADLMPRQPEQKPATPSQLSTLLMERGRLEPGDPNIGFYNEAIKKLTTHSPLVTVDTRQEGKFSETVGRELGEQYSGIMKADMNAPASIGKYNRLGQLLSQVNTGKFKGATTDLKAAAKSLGFDLTAMGIADDVAPAQAARALANQIALELRNPAGGAGMPGALSDKDREFLIQSIPGLENDPAAIGKMIEYRVKLEQRAQKVARMAREYRRKNGRFDEGFFDGLQDWSNKNPLFSEAATPAPAPAAPVGTLTPEEMSELESLRKRFKK